MSFLLWGAIEVGYIMDNTTGDLKPTPTDREGNIFFRFKPVVVFLKLIEVELLFMRRFTM